MNCLLISFCTKVGESNHPGECKNSMGHRPHFSLKELIGAYPNNTSKRTIEEKTAQSILKSLHGVSVLGVKRIKITGISKMSGMA